MQEFYILHFGDRSMKKSKVITNNREIYNKLNSLKFSNSISFSNKNIKPGYMSKIINNINRKQTKIVMEVDKNKITLKKINPLNVKIYLSTK